MSFLDSINPFGGGGGGGGSGDSGGIGNSKSSAADSHADNSLNGGNGAILSTISAATGSVINTSDQGAIGGAFDFAKGANAIQGQTFNDLISASAAGVHELVAAQSAGNSQLIDAASALFKRASDNASQLAGQTQQAVLSAYTNAASDKTSTIDNRTLIALALAAVAAIVLIMRSKG